MFYVIFILFLIFNSKLILIRLEYASVENLPAANPNNCVAVVSNLEVKDQTLSVRKDSIRQKKEESKDPYRWQYLTIAWLILASGVFGWIFFVRKNYPFSRRIRFL